MTNPKMKGNQLKDALVITGSVTVDNVKIDGNTLSSTDTDGDINITPDGAGSVVVSKALMNNTALSSGSSVEIALGWNSAQDFNGRNLANVGSFTATTSGTTGWSLGKGDIDGFVVKYNAGASVLITAGNAEANGKFYSETSSTVHVILGLASAFDFWYVYIDDSGSSQPNPVFIDSTTEPAWSDSKRGWYGTGTEPASPSTNDRCIGVASSGAGSLTLSFFSPNGATGKLIEYHQGSGAVPQMALNMNPTTSWLTPNENDGSVVTPANAVKIRIRLQGSDVGTATSIYAASAEMAVVETSIGNGEIYHYGYEYAILTDWINLGSSRNIKIAGADNDDNALSCYCLGWAISR
jgi:hypothetical protein